MKSSLGFHTLELRKALDPDGYKQLKKDISKYVENTGGIKTYYVDQFGKSVYIGKKGSYSDLIGKELQLKIEFYNKYNGVSWTIRRRKKEKTGPECNGKRSL